jgi:TPR repeat protein
MAGGRYTQYTVRRTMMKKNSVIVFFGFLVFSVFLTACVSTPTIIPLSSLDESQQKNAEAPESGTKTAERASFEQPVQSGPALLDAPDNLALAEQGDAEAQFDAALSYYEGKKVKKDDEKAFFWMGKAAEQGHIKAQFNMGAFYGNGIGVPKDREKAFFWYTKSAEQGLSNAQFVLGDAYLNGDGLPQDMEKAQFWLEKAAEQGVQQAQTYLQAYFKKGYFE